MKHTEEKWKKKTFQDVAWGRDNLNLPKFYRETKIKIANWSIEKILEIKRINQWNEESN